MAYEFTLSTEILANGKKVVYAQRNNSSEPKFIVGRRTSYKGDMGLVNDMKNGPAYNPADYAPMYGFWSYFIHPTAQAESSGAYNCLNTYDVAKFTFGFMQFAAHVADGDFVKLFKNLLALPNAKDYFPKLVVKDSRIFYVKSDGTLTQLESSSSTQALMDYLNPTLTDIETQEMICAARLVHWAINDPAHQRTQVDTAIQHMKKNMISYHGTFGLDGVPAKICMLVCDIRHQGRGKNVVIANALRTSGGYDKVFEKLCNIGLQAYPQRITVLRSTITNLQNTGILNKKYQGSTNSFIDM